MKKRVITSIVALAGIFPFFWFSEPLEAGNPLTYLFPLLFSAISFVSTWEMLHCLGLDKTYAVSVPFYLVSAAFPMLTRVLREDKAELARIAVLVSLLLAVYLFAVIVFRFGKIDLGRVALAFMTCFYFVGAYSATVLLRDVPQVGRFLFLLPFVFSWVTDIFAYFTGRLFGRHKLIPDVSPKKTVEGAIGGLVFCALSGLVYGLIVKAAFGVAPNYPILVICGALGSAVSQVGDLIMSAIKRQYGIKDYGTMLPGHGGLLDRFDSSIAVTVMLLVLSSYFTFFTV